VQHKALHELGRESVQGLVERGLMRPEFARDLFARWLPEHPHYYGEMIWIAMMLEQWLRVHAPRWRVG
jgi:asparagine synthase (glutamine-hydrolysing)